MLNPVDFNSFRKQIFVIRWIQEKAHRSTERERKAKDADPTSLYIFA